MSKVKESVRNKRKNYSFAKKKREEEEESKIWHIKTKRNDERGEKEEVKERGSERK